ncbi:response regulator transcription factor [Caulobacter sp. RHG1]|uniref:response regulator transcription factor n=1 Tax=Caulobacter sp. (strain RHG1) TaxID=2545762 RepID=UPI001557E733
MIDDDPMIRQFVELVLHQAGYRVSSASTGVMGVEALQASRWDLVLLDIELPDMTGLNVLGVLRRQRVRPPVMMMTAKGDAVTVRVALEAGAAGYLVKPFAAHNLLRRVEAMLRAQNHPPVQLARGAAALPTLASEPALEPKPKYETIEI